MTELSLESPVEIRLSADRTCLTLVWADGLRQEIGAAALRAGSRSAGAIRARLDGHAAAIPAGLTVSDLALVGRYGLNLGFSDGHDRGIYPWALLKDLGGATACARSGDVPPANAIP